MYQEPKNNPMIPNKQKEIFKERMEEENKFIPPKPMKLKMIIVKILKNLIIMLVNQMKNHY